MTSRNAQELSEAAQEYARSSQNLWASAICAHATGLRGIVQVDVATLHATHGSASGNAIRARCREPRSA